MHALQKNQKRSPVRAANCLNLLPEPGSHPPEVRPKGPTSVTAPEASQASNALPTEPGWSRRLGPPPPPVVRGSVGASGLQSRDRRAVLHPRLTRPATYWLGDNEQTDYFLQGLVFRITLLLGCAQGCARETIRLAVSLLPGPSEDLRSNLHNHLGADLKSSSSGCQGDFPGGPGVDNLAANVGDTGSLPGPGGFHMPQLLKPEGSRARSPREGSHTLLGRVAPLARN